MKRLIADGFPDRVDPVIADPVNDVKLDIAGGLRIIALPGHSAGQIGFGVPLGDGRTAWIVGDVIMNVLGPREPILYENRAEGLASIGRLAQTVNNSDFICPGHGSPIPVSPAVQSTLGTLSHEG
jgi:glyoxylase-like metal-dependent hydrolase (beta-lactamase superfamily II)